MLEVLEWTLFCPLRVDNFWCLGVDQARASQLREMIAQPSVWSSVHISGQYLAMASINYELKSSYIPLYREGAKRRQSPRGGMASAPDRMRMRPRQRR